MTFFYDELPREPKIVSRRRRWFCRLIWGILIFFAMIWISLRGLMTLGGNNPQLARGLEDYLRGATGLNAHIGRFGSVTFYPFISVDIGDVSFTQPGITGWSVATVGHLTTRANFWDIFFHRGTVAQFELRDLDLGGSLNLAQPLRIDRAVITKTDKPGVANLTINGRFGADAFDGVVTMGWRLDSLGLPAFFLPPRSAVSFKSRLLSVTGTLTRIPGGGLQLEDANLVTPHTAFHGSVALMTTMAGANWRADLANKNSRMIADLDVEPKTLSGTVEFKHLDMGGGPSPSDMVNDIAAILPGNTLRSILSQRTGKITLTIDTLTEGAQAYGQLSAPIQVDHGLLTAAPLNGALGNGVVSGRFTLDTRGKENLSFETKGRVAGWKLNKGNGAHGDALFDLHGSAADPAAMLNALAGEIAVTASAGRLGSFMTNVPKPLINANLARLLIDVPLAHGQPLASSVMIQIGADQLTGTGTVSRHGIDANVGQVGQAGPKYNLHGGWDHLSMTQTDDSHATTPVPQPPANLYKAFSQGDLGLVPGLQP